MTGEGIVIDKTLPNIQSREDLIARVHALIALMQQGRKIISKAKGTTAETRFQGGTYRVTITHLDRVSR